MSCKFHSIMHKRRTNLTMHVHLHWPRNITMCASENRPKSKRKQLPKQEEIAYTFLFSSTKHEVYSLSSTFHLNETISLTTGPHFIQKLINLNKVLKLPFILKVLMNYIHSSLSTFHPSMKHQFKLGIKTMFIAKNPRY